MNVVQLEMNLFNESEEDFRISFIEKRQNEMNESMRKMRGKLFAELNDLKKICTLLIRENETLKHKLQVLCDEKTEWVYGQDGYLFNVRENVSSLG